MRLDNMWPYGMIGYLDLSAQNFPDISLKLFKNGCS